MVQQNLAVCKHLYIWFLFISQCYGLGAILPSLYLIILCLLYLLQFAINTYLWHYNTPVLNTSLFRAQLYKEILLRSLLIDIAHILLNYSHFLYYLYCQCPCHCPWSYLSHSWPWPTCLYVAHATLYHLAQHFNTLLNILLNILVSYSMYLNAPSLSSQRSFDILVKSALCLPCI